MINNYSWGGHVKIGGVWNILEKLGGLQHFRRFTRVGSKNFWNYSTSSMLINTTTWPQWGRLETVHAFEGGPRKLFMHLRRGVKFVTLMEHFNPPPPTEMKCTNEKRIWNNQDTNLSWYVRKANVDHTISGQETALSTLDHSATTLGYHLNPTLYTKTWEGVYFSIPGMVPHWSVFRIYELMLFWDKRGTVWSSEVWCKTWASITTCKMIEKDGVVSVR